MQRGQQPFDKKSQGMVYGQKTRTPHLMRISLIIVGVPSMPDGITGTDTADMSPTLVTHMEHHLDA